MMKRLRRAMATRSASNSASASGLSTCVVRGIFWCWSSPKPLPAPSPSLSALAPRSEEIGRIVTYPTTTTTRGIERCVFAGNMVDLIASDAPEGVSLTSQGRTRRRTLRPRPKHLSGDTYSIEVGNPPVHGKLAGSLPIKQQQQEELRD